MQIKPLSRVTYKPVTLLVPRWRELTAYTETEVITVNGVQACFKLLESLEDHALYVSNSLKDLLNCTGSNYWQAEVWKGHVTTMSLDGTKVKVHSLRRILDSVDKDEDRFSALMEMFRWLEGLGVTPGSISSMAWSLWRSSLDSNFTLNFDSTIGRAAFYGGRQEASPGVDYKDMVALDISSAYPFEMASRPYAGTLRQVSVRTDIDPQVPGLAQAAVKVPDELPHAPLPSRVTEDLIQWPKGIVSGVWTWQELAAAKSLGCEVKIQRCWAPITLVEPFTAWWDIVREGRTSLSPTAAKLVKSLSNSLWGMFGMTGESRGMVRWLDNLGHQPEMIARAGQRLPQASTAHIAAETSSRVRTRMLLEGLYGGQDHEPNYPAHIDTDGVIVPRSALDRFAPYMLGNKSGQWRVKTNIHKLEVKAPQLYRYTCSPSCVKSHRWHYVAAGMTETQARNYFEKAPRGFDISLAGSSSADSSNFSLQRDLAILDSRRLNSSPN